MSETATADILHVLQAGTFEIEGLLPWSSNYTFLVQICGRPLIGGAELSLSAVYKPRQGERPLWDFAQGTLCLRERAAFLASQQLGWQLVPPTVLRRAEHGIGSVQLFIEHDPERHYFTFEGEQSYRTQLQKMVLFDILVNNADRKSGHVLLQINDGQEGQDRLWGIDHGICFHTEYKLRTVIWEFMGQSIPQSLLGDLHRFNLALNVQKDPFLTELSDLLSVREIKAMRQRLQNLLRQKTFPNPGPGRHYPWPPI